MVTFLRPFPHAYGPAAVNVRLRRSHHRQPSSSVPCHCSSLRPMAQDPSHPHRQSKEHGTSPTSQQELTQQLPPAPSSPPRDVVQEPSTSSSSSRSSDTSSWLKLGIGQSPGQGGSPSPSSSSRRKRPRNDYEAGPSTPAQPAAPPRDLELSLFPLPASSFPPSSASAVATGAVVAAAPPPAHEAGTWFVLQAAQNQRREPPLPQIPRSYLRVRDGRMTVRVVMRYLVNKLGLQDDSQLDITCQGQSLLPAMTLQHVRDTIWRPPPAEAAAVLPAPGSSSMNQVMTLHYGRS